MIQKLFVSEAGLQSLNSRKVMNLLRTPKDIRQGAVKEACSHLKTYYTNFSKRLVLREKYPNARAFKSDIKFNPGFKCKTRWTSDSVALGKGLSYVNNESVKLFPKSLVGLVAAKGIDEQDVLCDAKLHWKLGRLYLLTCKRTTLTPVTITTDRDICCAIDPGVRKFATVYSPEGRVEVLGANTNKVIDKCIRRIDKQKTKLTFFAKKFSDLKQVPRQLTMSGSYREKLSKLRLKLRRAKMKYRNAELKATFVVRDLHYKAANFLCSNYKTVLYPDFNAHDIAGGTLRKIVKRRLNMLSFFKFQNRLIETATRYDTIIMRGSEAYTSKQCGRCGKLNDNLGGNELYKCADESCNYVCDRDVHGARNIMLRWLQ